MNTSITIDTPYMTIDEFSRRSGMTIPTIRRYIQEGFIETMPKKGRGAKSLTLINNAAMTLSAIKSANVNIDLSQFMGDVPR